jgi:ATP-dependent Clp protease ATP-binding subunit ClpA
MRESRPVPPEFLNRIDETIFFEHWAGVALPHRADPAPPVREAAGRRQMSLHLTDGQSRIAEAGYDPVYGASLKRALQKLVIDPLAATSSPGLPAW